jgi:hypothetical protein
MIFQLYTVAFGLQRTNRYRHRQECEGIFFGALYPIVLGCGMLGGLRRWSVGDWIQRLRIGGRFNAAYTLLAAAAVYIVET